MKDIAQNWTNWMNWKKIGPLVQQFAPAREKPQKTSPRGRTMVGFHKIFLFWYVSTAFGGEIATSYSFSETAAASPRNLPLRVVSNEA